VAGVYAPARTFSILRLVEIEAKGPPQDAEIAVERTKVEQALAELSRVAERLAALAEERARPWWRRIVG
jgi:hypothetical protein